MLVVNNEKEDVKYIRLIFKIQRVPTTSHADRFPVNVKNNCFRWTFRKLMAIRSMSQKTNFCCRRSCRENRNSHISFLHGACYTPTNNHREVAFPVRSHRTVATFYLSVKIPESSMNHISRSKLYIYFQNAIECVRSFPPRTSEAS